MLTPLARQILSELRHGSLDYWELAAELDDAPFAVLAELKHLRRLHLVRDLDYEMAWELTDRGLELACSGAQLELGQ